MTKSLKKPLSVEKEIEYLRFAMREPCGCKACEDERANIGDNCVIRQALTQAHQAGVRDAMEIVKQQKTDIENGVLTKREKFTALEALDDIKEALSTLIKE